MVKTEKQLEDYEVLHYNCTRAEQLSYLTTKTAFQNFELDYRLQLLDSLSAALPGSEKEANVLTAMRRFVTSQTIKEVDAYLCKRRSRGY